MSTVSFQFRFQDLEPEEEQTQDPTDPTDQTTHKLSKVCTFREWSIAPFLRHAARVDMHFLDVPSRDRRDEAAERISRNLEIFVDVLNKNKVANIQLVTVFISGRPTIVLGNVARGLAMLEHREQLEMILLGLDSPKVLALAKKLMKAVSTRVRLLRKAGI